MTATYTIDVLRKKEDGILTFSSNGVSVSTKCWWDPKMVIVAGTYQAAATRMTNKTDGFDGGNREGIWMGKGIKYNGGANVGNGAFIHKGTSPSWSDGCIVCAADEVTKIWKAINPKEAMNVSVVVRDEVEKIAPVVPDFQVYPWGLGCQYLP